jgi:hypothetical protein
MLTSEVAKVMLSEEKEVLSICRNHADAIEDSSDPETGLPSWFDAFLQSEKFQNLKPEQKKETFRLHGDLCSILNQLDAIRL